MSSYEEQELKQLENALTQLTPRVAKFDRDKLLFEAGRRSVQPKMFWCGCTIAMTAVTILLTVALVARSRSDSIVEVFSVPAKTADAIETKPADGADLAVPVHVDELSLPASSMLRMQQATQMNGGVLPVPPSAPAGAALPRDPTMTVGSRSVLGSVLLTGDE